MINLLDLHTHTTASGHTHNSPYEMAKSASEHDMCVFGCSDHTPAMPGTCHYCHSINFKVIPRTLYGMELMMGVELNIMGHEGGVDLEQDLLQNLDCAIASLHHPCIESGTMAQDTNAYLDVMKNPAIHIIGHPDDSRYPVDYDTLVNAARKHKTLLEVNNSSLNPMSFRQGARENYLKMLELCKYYKTPVVVGNDAHCEADSGNHTFAYALLEEASFSPKLMVNISLDLLAGYIPRLTSILTQPNGARCGQTGKGAGNTTPAGGTASAGNTASAGGTDR